MMAATFCFVFLSALALSSAQTTRVTTKYGEVQGNLVTLASGVQVRSFFGVPYAKPPVGPLRFKPTQEVEPWTGVFNATRLGAACGGGTGLTHPEFDNFSEDCLNLNIHAPNKEGSFPVMVYYHGGEYSSGANILYPGHFYAARDVIVVVVNYRYSTLGWLSTGDDVAKGNYGLWDQRQALVFIQETISSFGGDKERVTIFGQSAGASSTGLHIVSPQSAGLFHQAILISGSDLVPWSFNPVWLPPENYTRQVALKLNCPTDNSQNMVACLRGKTYEEIRSQGVDRISGYISLGFAPTVDGAGGFLPDDPYVLRYRQEFTKNIRVMGGHTTEDGSLYLLPFVPEADDGGWNQTTHRQYIRERLVNWVLARAPEEIQDYVEAAMSFYYTDWPYTEDLERNRRKLVELVTDVGFGFGLDWVMKNHTQYNTTYEYLFGYRGNPHRELLPEWYGCLHGIGDIPFFWGFPLLEDNPEVEDDQQHYLMSIFPWTDEDKAYSNYFMDLFANFAKTGNPTPSPVVTPGGSPLTWTPFTSDSYNYISIQNNGVTMEENLNQRNNAFWQEYMQWIVFDRQGSEPALEPSFGGQFDTTKIDEFYQELKNIILLGNDRADRKDMFNGKFSRN